MLARIADVAPDAASDHSGELLRFADRGQLGHVRARLRDLGYESEELLRSERQAPPEGEWYRPADLSREEARVLGARIVPAFIREHAIDPAVAAALHERVEAALFGCFVTHPIGSDAPAGSSRTECAEAAAAASGDILAPGQAHALGQFVDRWLSA